MVSNVSVLWVKGLKFVFPCSEIFINYLVKLDLMMEHFQFL